MFNDWWGGYRHSIQYTGVPLRASVVVVGEAAAEIVTLDAMRAALKVNPTDTSNDDYIRSLIISARHHGELHTNRSLSKKPYLMSLSRFPNVFYDRTDKINLWYPPLTGNVSIKYIDKDGAQQTMISGQNFQVDSAGEPGRVAPLAQSFWPSTKIGALNAVQIFYTAGYEAGSSLRQNDAEANNVHEPETETVQVPESGQVSTLIVDRTIPNDLVLAIKQLVMHWYQNRVPIVTIAGAGGTHAVLPWHVEKIFDNRTYETLTPTITPEY
jgi:uncharacterized phiE125 gp8 family phage protein